MMLRRIPWFQAALALACVTAASPALAQTGSGDGYLFRRPSGGLTVRVGVARPTADSRVFSFASEQLTLGDNAYTGFSVAADLDVAVSSRIALQFGTALSARETGSEYRDFVDNNDLPIEQRTSFRRLPVTAGLRVYLTEPGRSVGRLAWVPNKFAPYVAGGGGLMYHSFRQTGDFVDFQDFDVFASTVETSGWAAMAYGAAGLNYSLSAKVGLTTEARYESARAPMGSDFVGFGRIDLSGFSFTTGLHLRF
ncbi:MAG: hypothetical protein IT353_14985 [Gemmatimonadaceae bacterium]|nr:hypothetical protein [Gemmatimonadaceae bacterium]